MGESTTFFDIVANSGIVGVIAWGWIFISSAIGVILGVVSLIQAFVARTAQTPISFKLLLSCVVTTILVGASGTLTGYADSVVGLASNAGAAHAQLLHFSLKQSRVCFHFTLASSMAQLVFLTIAWTVFSSRLTRIGVDHPSLIQIIRKISPLIRVFILLAIPTVWGAVQSVLLIEDVLVLKPGERLPSIAGMGAATALSVCFCCCLAGILVLIVYIVKGVPRSIHLASRGFVIPS